MLNPDWIQCWKVKEAYALTDDEVQSLLFEESVHRCVMTPWLSLFTAGTKVEVKIPFNNAAGELPPEFENLYDPAFMDLMLRLFSELLRAAATSTYEAVKEFFLFIIDVTYDDGYGEDIVSQVISLANALFTVHPDRCAPYDTSKYIIAGNSPPNDLFPRVDYYFFNKVFIDSILVHKKTAIRYLHSCDFSLQYNVRGLSRALVDRVLAESVPVNEEISLLEEPKPAIVEAVEEVGTLSPSEKEEIWKEYLEKEIKDYTYHQVTGRRKKRDVFDTEMSIFIEIVIAKKKPYRLRRDNPKLNISRALKNAKENLVPYMLEKYPSLPKP